MAVAKKRTRMKRTQISLMPEDYDKAQRIAERHHTSLSQVVRDLLRGAPEDECFIADPLRDLIGMVKDADPRGSVDHDEFLYGHDIH